MKRLFSRITVLSVATLVGVALLSGCKTDPVSLTLRDFASIRVMNFTQSDPNSAICAVPIDVYLNRVGQTPDSLAIANSLKFGQSSVYASNLFADAGGTDYDLTVRPTPAKNKALRASPDILRLLPGQRYTYILISSPYDPSTYDTIFVQDGNAPNYDSKKAYVRFINVQPGASKDDPNPLSLYVNDPLHGDAVAENLNYKGSGGYVGLTTALDSAYTFFVRRPGSDQVLSRIGFQSFGPGTFHTIVYGGDLCRVAPRDTTGDPADSLRLRVFDDNTAGNDQTFPIPQTFRYNIINAMVPTVTQYDKLGFLVNNEGNPQFNNLTFAPVPKFGTAPGFSTTADGVLETQYANSILTDAVDIKGYTVDAAGVTGPLVFDIHAVKKASAKPTIISDMPVSFILYDTVRNGKAADSATMKHTTIPLPDQSYHDSVRIVLVNALVREKGITVAKVNATFKVNGTTDVPMSGGTGAAPGRSDVFTYAIDPNSGGEDCTITSTLSAGGTVSRTFKVVPGGIYEVVLVGSVLTGSPNPPQYIVVRLNPTGK